MPPSRRGPIVSFNHYARKVMNPGLPAGVRYSALHSCILRLVWMTGEPFADARDRFAAQSGFRRQDPTDQQLLAALALIERERNLALQQLRAYERRRIREKARGWRAIPESERKALRRLYGMEPGPAFHPDPARVITPLPEEQRVERLRQPAPEDA
jgi:hypothetical protein